MIEQAILIGLAAFRIANFLVNEDGPFDVAERLRRFVGLEPGEVSGFLPQLFSCMFCMTVWTSIVGYLLWVVEPVLVIIVASMTIALLPHIWESR